MNPLERCGCFVYYWIDRSDILPGFWYGSKHKRLIFLYTELTSVSGVFYEVKKERLMVRLRTSVRMSLSSDVND